MTIRKDEMVNTTGTAFWGLDEYLFVDGARFATLDETLPVMRSLNLTMAYLHIPAQKVMLTRQLDMCLMVLGYAKRITPHQKQAMRRVFSRGADCRIPLPQMELVYDEYLRSSGTSPWIYVPSSLVLPG